MNSKNLELLSQNMKNSRRSITRVSIKSYIPKNLNISENRSFSSKYKFEVLSGINKDIGKGFKETYNNLNCFSEYNECYIKCEECDNKEKIELIVDNKNSREKKIPLPKDSETARIFINFMINEFGCPKKGFATLSDLFFEKKIIDSVQLYDLLNGLGCLEKYSNMLTRGKGKINGMYSYATHDDSNCTHRLFIDATLNNRLDILQWALKKGYGDLFGLSVIAAKHGYLDILKWIKENDAWEISQHAYTAAAMKGNFKILEWLEENGCHYDWSIRHDVILRGDSETVKKFLIWLKENKKIDKFEPGNLYSKAIYLGRLDVVKVLHELEFNWNADTCATAAAWDRLEILKYLRKNGCPWDKEVYVYAIARKHWKLYDWAKENGCPSD